MYTLALNERDHLAMADIATRCVRTVAKEVIVPTIVCYLKSGGPSGITLTWDKTHRKDALTLTKQQGAVFSPTEILALARAVEARVEAEALQSWVMRKREVRDGGVWLLDEREALLTRPKALEESKVARVTNEAGFAWQRHETVGATVGGILAYFRLVPYLCAFPDEPLKVLPQAEKLSR